MNAISLRRYIFDLQLKDSGRCDAGLAGTAHNNVRRQFGQALTRWITDSSKLGPITAPMVDQETLDAFKKSG